MFIPSNAGPDLRWLDDSACAELEISDFFVEAGHVISEETLDICRTCPVRRECVAHAFSRGIVGGYFGGISPGQRRDMKSMAEADAYISTDPPRSIPEHLEGDGLDLALSIEPLVLARLRAILSKAHRAQHEEEAAELREKAFQYATTHGLSLLELEDAGVV